MKLVCILKACWLNASKSACVDNSWPKSHTYIHKHTAWQCLFNAIWMFIRKFLMTIIRNDWIFIAASGQSGVSIPCAVCHYSARFSFKYLLIIAAMFDDRMKKWTWKSQNYNYFVRWNEHWFSSLSSLVRLFAKFVIHHNGFCARPLFFGARS